MSFASFANSRVSSPPHAPMLAAAATRATRRGARATLRWIAHPTRSSPFAHGGSARSATTHAAEAPAPQGGAKDASSRQQPAGAPPPSTRAQQQAQDRARQAQWQRQQQQQQPQPRPSHQQQQQQPQRAPQQQRQGGGGGGAYGGAAQTPARNGGGYRGMLPEEIDALYHQMQHLGSQWADLHAEAELLEESKKCVLASITLHYMNDGDSKSQGEARAFAAPEYKEHINKMVEARRRANQAKVEFEGIKTHMNLTRTYEASRREEMKML